MAAAPTVPLNPLLTYWAKRNPPHQQSNCVCTQGGVCGSLEALADRLGVSRSTMIRRRAQGTLTLTEAEAWCGRLRVLPTVIWPKWYQVPVTAALTGNQQRWNGRLFA